MKLSAEQDKQEQEYNLPYHYIPDHNNSGFSQVLSWSWGMNYLAGLELVLSILDEIAFTSLLDVGCGDGRFLREATKRYPELETLGIDYSENAVLFAKAFNPDIEYSCIDIAAAKLARKFDVITMIEVLEHIPPDEIPRFLRGVSSSMNENSKLVITVPHLNKKIIDKHYQHFSVDTLRKTLEPVFNVEKIVPFDRISKFNGRFLKLLGYTGSNYLITSKALNSFLYKRILHGCLTEQPESMCGRLLAVASLK